jgi:hypothetical protein
MTEDQIDEMVTLIAGSFPTSGVYKHDVMKAWSRVDLIANMTVDEGRAVQKHLVTRLDRFPSVGDVMRSYGALFGRRRKECPQCMSSGWVYPRDKHGEKLTFESSVARLRGVKYTGVVACEHCNN